VKKKTRTRQPSAASRKPTRERTSSARGSRPTAQRPADSKGAPTIAPGKRIVVTGSVAFDYLMTFPGKFTEHLIPDKMHRLSVSFLVDEMRRVPGGCGPNIAYGLALLGERPVLLATAGKDAEPYREKLARDGVDVSWLRIEPDVFTASFFVSTDQDQNQLASFYTGAMARARGLRLAAAGLSTIAFVVISPNDPPAMAQLTADCRAAGIPFLYDPSQQVTRLSGEEMREGLRGAAILIVNDYEFGILTHKTGLSREQLEREAPVVIVTHGPDGSTIHAPDGRGGRETHAIPAAKVESEAVDPTGVGDMYRAGLLRGLRIGAPWPVAGRIGSISAVFGIESLGPQPPRYAPGDFIARYRRNFGDAEELSRLFGDGAKKPPGGRKAAGTAKRRR
jgi:adenosine kinase